MKVSTLNKIITQTWPLVLDQLEVLLPPEALDALSVQPCLNSNVHRIGQKRLVLVAPADGHSTVGVAPCSQVRLCNEMVPFGTSPVDIRRSYGS